MPIPIFWLASILIASTKLPALKTISLLGLLVPTVRRFELDAHLIMAASFFDGLPKYTLPSLVSGVKIETPPLPPFSIINSSALVFAVTTPAVAV